MPQKKKNNSSLGRALMKERFGGRHNTSGNKASSQHMREYAEIADPATLNLKSVTELSSLDEFLETAELAGTEFTAERMNIEYVQPANFGVISSIESRLIEETQEKYKEKIVIPKRPKWTSETSAEELNVAEKESFLQWRRSLAEIQEQEHITLTPYEKNLDFWRQLWRVIERSNLVVQIVDARDPLLYRCKDLENYVKDVDPNKKNMILINKADLLSQKQREAWAEYFDEQGVIVAFWSATLEAENTIQPDSLSIEKYEPIDKNNPSMLDKYELISFFKSELHHIEGCRTVGMVGYPNVGKSSTINTILQSKKVAVSATPGRTKHFQTFFIENDFILCDCPGLVFPSFVSNKAEMILSGILSIDEMRDHVGPINLVCQRIPRQVLEVTYGINIAKPIDGEDESRPPTSQELLDAYGLMRGFMTSRGQPDNPRSARIVLKDFVKGKLLYCRSPQVADQEKYSSWNYSVIQHVLQMAENAPDENAIEEILVTQRKVERLQKQDQIQPKNEVDEAFFDSQNVKAFTKGTLLGGGGDKGSKSENDFSKPWKKHNNKNKKEKVKRTRNPYLY
uniref:large subunit GTPase 1 homolog n=1 Tax=Styela clava TaxID=7725 RepID=UPI0019395A36|nr:large subunit GTPase 1 homolog [Styela clava]